MQDTDVGTAGDGGTGTDVDNSGLPGVRCTVVFMVFLNIGEGAFRGLSQKSKMSPRNDDFFLRGYWPPRGSWYFEWYLLLPWPEVGAERPW